MLFNKVLGENEKCVLFLVKNQRPTQHILEISTDLSIEVFLLYNKTNEYNRMMDTDTENKLVFTKGREVGEGQDRLRGLQGSNC